MPATPRNLIHAAYDRDALAAPVLLAVLGVLGPCSIPDLDRLLGGYSPGEDRLAVVLTALAAGERVARIERVEIADDLVVKTCVFSLPTRGPE